MKDVVGIVLAAGESKRMGTPKALLVWRGETFLDRVRASLEAAGIEEIRVVVGPWAAGRPVSADRCTVLQNPRPEDGPISSLRIALASPGTQASLAIVCQVDHPAVRTETVQELVRKARSMPGAVVVPTHEGRGGHPVAIPKELFPALLDPRASSLRDAILAHPQDRVHRWECGDSGVLVDVDTPADLERLVGSGA